MQMCTAVMKFALYRIDLAGIFREVKNSFNWKTVIFVSIN